MNKPYSISVGTHNQYENEIAQIDFKNYYSLLISQESKIGDFDVIAISVTEEQVGLFNNGKHNPWECIKLSHLENAIKEAKDLLLKMN